MTKYQFQDNPDDIVEAELFEPHKNPWPVGVIPWPENGPRPKDMSWGYMQTTPKDRVHVLPYDYIVTDSLGTRAPVDHKYFEKMYHPVIALGTPAQVPSFRRFKLVRTTDITGISGTGEIVVGVQWPDQSATLFWLKTETNGYYKSLDQLQQIHCYNDASGQPNARVEWID